MIDIRGSADRLRSLLDLGAPPVLVDDECRLLVWAVASQVGAERVRRWLTELSDCTAAALVSTGGAECLLCRGLGSVRSRADGGRSVQCPRCSGLGVA